LRPLEFVDFAERALDDEEDFVCLFFGDAGDFAPGEDFEEVNVLDLGAL